MYDSWTVLSVTKGPGVIPDYAKHAFKRAACRLHRERKDQMLFQTDGCSGMVKTEWNTHRVGNRSGVLFHVEVESAEGQWQVNFLLHDVHLEEGAKRLDDIEFHEEGEWGDAPERFPVEDLYDFEDLRPRYRN